ncbi:MAG: heme-binding domain-containing protein [Saprospiraceae bacterium]|nr:heme-binding domain-containing protein [Saprospiraceae bacterium]
MLKKIGIAVVVILVLMQFKRIDKTNPEFNEAEDFITITQPPTEIATLIKNACYDCHSHQSKYPWYSNVAPASWMLEHHIEEGRQHLNFSTWATYPEKKADHKLEECVEEVEEGNMPMKPYIIMHSEAKMTDAQKTVLVEWFESQRK